MNKEQIAEAYQHLRKTDHTVPDNVLDFMYQSALEKLEEHENIVVYRHMCLVLPPKEMREEYDMKTISLGDLAFSKESAWEKFLSPALKRDGYEKDGYEAQIVKVKVMV